MSRYTEKQEVTVSFKLTPLTWFLVLQGLLLHYKITGVLLIDWLYALLPTLAIVAGTIGWLIAGMGVEIWRNYHKPPRRL